MIETLARIEAPHFTAGIVLRKDIVVAAAPIVHYMARGLWTRTRAWHYCSAKGWRVRVVRNVTGQLCPRCGKQPADPVFLGNEGHICGDCWVMDRHEGE